jgi:hypothetical protein
MTGSEITGLVISSGLGLMIIALSIILLIGRGSFLIAGFNTMSAEKKERYDKIALCKFMGRILLPIGILCPGMTISGILNLSWFPAVFIIVVLGLIIFAAVYANTGNRFRK